MIYRNFLSTTFIIATTLLSSCTGSLKYRKRADEFARIGYYKSAATYYLTSLKKNTTNKKARAGLILNSQKVMNDYLEEFVIAHSDEKHYKAVYAYKKITDYDADLVRFDIHLDYPQYCKIDYLEDLEFFLKERYETGRSLFDEGNFAPAKAVFEEIRKFDSNYKDVPRLLIISQVEPIYQEAELCLEKEEYRTAYYKYSEILNIDNEYKDVNEKREYAFKNSIFNITIINENRSFVEKTNELNHKIHRKLAQTNNPFLVSDDKTRITNYLIDQGIDLSGVITNKSAVYLGDMLKVKAILVCRIQSLKEIEGPLEVEEKTAYTRESYKDYDSETKTSVTKYRYEEATYYSYYQENTVEIKFKYQLLSVETGETLISGTINDQASDHIRYTSNPGGSTLYPSQNPSKLGILLFRTKFIGKRNMKSFDKIGEKIYESISNQVSNEIVSYEKTRL